LPIDLSIPGHNQFIVTMHTVFVTGGTGYMGQRLIPLLSDRGHKVTAVVREGSFPLRATTVVANPLVRGSYTSAIAPADTFIHLIGTPHPSPAKAKQFREVDLVSVGVAIEAAAQANVRHFIYLSVAQPAPMMKAFLAVRAEGESMIRDLESRPLFYARGMCSAPDIVGRTSCFHSTGSANVCPGHARERAV
jgi:nucleoside-diphosphate-sugar epimerase